jgi:AmiR/NasT family two-component response regulator
MCQESSSMLERSCIAWQRYGDQREFLGEAGFESLTVLKMGAIGDKLAKVGLPPPLVKARGSYNVKNAMEKDLAATKAELAELKRTNQNCSILPIVHRYNNEHVKTQDFQLLMIY